MTYLMTQLTYWSSRFVLMLGKLITRLTSPLVELVSLLIELAQGRPIQVWINRQSGATYPTGDTPDRHPQVTVWPTPDQGTALNPYYTFVYWRMRRIQDAGTGVNTQDIPFRFVNAMVAGLAWYLAQKLPEVDIQRAAALKAEYEQQFQLAADEDREKAPIRFIPRQQFLGNG
jgi:hypothetical protein